MGLSDGVGSFYQSSHLQSSSLPSSFYGDSSSVVRETKCVWDITNIHIPLLYGTSPTYIFHSHMGHHQHTYSIVIWDITNIHIPLSYGTLPIYIFHCHMGHYHYQYTYSIVIWDITNIHIPLSYGTLEIYIFHCHMGHYQYTYSIVIWAAMFHQD